MHGRQLLFPRRKEHAAAGLAGEFPERAFTLERNPGDAADADHVHRGVRRLRRHQRVLYLRLAVLVVSVGNQHDDVPPFSTCHEARGFDEAVGNRRASSGRDCRHGARDRLAIAGWPGDGSERLRERRHDDAIVRPEEVGEPSRGRANELHAGMHALAGVHQQRVGHRQRFDADEVDRSGARRSPRRGTRRHRGRRRSGRPCPRRSLRAARSRRRWSRQFRMERARSRRRRRFRAHHSLRRESASARRDSRRSTRRRYGGPSASSPTRASFTKNLTGPSAICGECETCATMRIAPGRPVRPSGDVMRTEKAGVESAARAVAAARPPISAHATRLRNSLTRTPERAPRLPRSSRRTRPGGVRPSAVAARRGTRPARAPDRSDRADDTRVAGFHVRDSSR